MTVYSHFIQVHFPYLVLEKSINLLTSVFKISFHVFHVNKRRQLGLRLPAYSELSSFGFEDGGQKEAKEREKY